MPVDVAVDPGVTVKGSPVRSLQKFLDAELTPAQREEVFRGLPAERILVETDAPDLRPPDERNPRPLRDAQGEAINHPANIDLAHRALAELRGLTPEALAGQVAENFARLFGSAMSE